FRFFALYSSFFLVRTSVSVRMVVSQRPVSFPRRSMVAMACETASCRYPFSWPRTRRCFFGGTGCAGASDESATTDRNSKFRTRLMKGAHSRSEDDWIHTNAREPAEQARPQSSTSASRVDRCSPLLGGLG